MNAAATYNKDLLLRALRLSPTAYSELVYEQGLRYLQQYLNGDVRTARVLEGMASYWAWWCHQWDRRNAEFIKRNDVEKFLPHMDAWYRSQLLGAYQQAHDGTGVATEGVRIARKVLLEVINAPKVRNT